MAPVVQLWTLAERLGIDRLADATDKALRAAGEPNEPDAYAFKVERPDGSLEYLRGIVMGPVFPGGRNEDFVLNNFTLGLNQVPLRVAAP